MKKLYYLPERNGIWQLKDATTGKRQSLKTTSKAEAIKLADAKYEGASDVRFNTRMSAANSASRTCLGTPFSLFMVSTNMPLSPVFKVPPSASISE